MNLTKLFEMQRELDKRIEQEHPREEGRDRLAEKILALQVELGECANEWRGFKFWSKDQKPRTDVSRYERHGDPPVYRNLLLEEYVDCLHFVLSIGLELDFVQEYKPYSNRKTTNIFIYLNQRLGDLFDNPTHGNYGRVMMVFLDLGKTLSFTWDEIEAAYFDKNKINHQRQETGY